MKVTTLQVISQGEAKLWGCILVQEMMWVGHQGKSAVIFAPFVNTNCFEALMFPEQLQNIGVNSALPIAHISVKNENIRLKKLTTIKIFINLFWLFKDNIFEFRYLIKVFHPSPLISLIIHQVDSDEWDKTDDVILISPFMCKKKYSIFHWKNCSEYFNFPLCPSNHESRGMFVHLFVSL